MSRDGSLRIGQARGKGRNRGTGPLKDQDGWPQDGLEEGREKDTESGQGGLSPGRGRG